jgi:Holliday junction resolvase RusA-like endonuclease
VPRELGFVIPGEPLAWARAGARGKGRFTPAPQKNFMGAIRTICAAEMDGAPPLDCPLVLEIHANYLWPASWSARKRGRPGAAWKTSRPDPDNIAKIVMDALNTVAWTDDARIASLHVWKQYAETAGLMVRVRALG